MKHFFKILYIATKIAVIVTPVILLGWLVKQDLALSGQLEFTYDFSKDSAAITNLFPANRLTPVTFNKSGFWQTIKQEPVYFETRLPQKFNTAQVEVVYQNSTEPLVQLGLKTLGDEWSYDFKPLENQLLDKLDWFKIEDERGTIWQRQKKYLNWDQFFDQLKSLDNFAVYNYPLNRRFLLANYQPPAQRTEFNRTIRGAHSFYTYIKDEVLDFSFTVQDINRSDGPDPLIISLYDYAGKKIYTQDVQDDGLISRFDKASDKRIIPLKISGLPEGVYRLELACSDEIFFRNISTAQKYLTFINR